MKYPQFLAKQFKKITAADVLSPETFELIMNAYKDGYNAANEHKVVFDQAISGEDFLDELYLSVYNHLIKDVSHEDIYLVKIYSEHILKEGISSTFYEFDKDFTNWFKEGNLREYKQWFLNQESTWDKVDPKIMNDYFNYDMDKSLYPNFQYDDFRLFINQHLEANALFNNIRSEIREELVDGYKKQYEEFGFDPANKEEWKYRKNYQRDYYG